MKTLITKKNLADLANVLLRSTTMLEAESDYKFFKFTRTMDKSLKEIIEEERELQERNEVLKDGLLDQGAKGFSAYIAEREMLLAEEVELDVKYKFSYPDIACVCANNRITQKFKILLCELLLEEKE